MGAGDPYATLALFKTRLGITDTNDDTALTAALASASLDIEGWCGRQFNTNAAVAGSGAPVTYSATTVVDTGAKFYLAMVGQVVTSTANTATITGFTDPSHLVTSTWAPGTPSAGDAYTIPAQVSARVYYPDDLVTIYVDDFSTTAGLIVAFDFSNSGTYSSIIASGNYQLEPLNGVVDGTSGWPFYRIHIIQTWAPIWWTSIGYPRASVQITAQWGWAAVPAPIQLACLMLAEENFKMKDAPFGVAGFSQYGPVRVQDNPKVAALLARYARSPIQVA
jgi:Phage gp6-like head-tail connector protein